MRQNMRRTLGILLGLTLALGLMLGLSITALAKTAGGVYSSFLVERTDEKAILHEKAVSFNNIDWYIIKDESTPEGDGTVTLLAKECLGESIFGNNNTYRGSAVETWLSTYYSQNFSSVDSAVISVTPSNPDGRAAKLYLLSVDEIKSLIGEQTLNQVNQAEYLKCQAFGTGRYYWWLRSPNITPGDTESANWVNGVDGYFYNDGRSVKDINGVRPSLQLKLSSVVFIKESKTFLLPQTISASDVTVTYGDMDKKITAKTTGDGAISYAVKAGSEDYINVDASTGMLTILKAGTATVTVTAAKTDVCVEATKDVTVTINKAEPTANAPVASAIYGQTLADVALENPDGNTEGSWAWMNSSAGVGNVGSRVFKAQFTPNDTTNNNGKKNVYVTVTVEKGDNPATVTDKATVVRGGNTVDLADNVGLNGATGAVRYSISGSRNGCKLNGSELISGDKTGSVIVNVIVGADDNYMALAATPITVTINEKAKQIITAADVTVAFGETNKKITASTTGDGAISYTVKNDSVDYIDVDATTGALTVKKVPVDGKAYVTVTAAETPTYVKATKDVTIYIGKAKAVAATVTANSPKYNATAQPLVTVDESTLVGGKMVYAVTKDKKAPEASAYTEKIPEKKSAGAYYVWYKAVGDADHADSDAARLKVIVYQRGIGDCKITVKDLSYTGKTLKPKVTVKYGKTTLKEGRDYKLTYSNKLINPGEWHVKVVGLGNYKGSKKLAFKVYLPKIKNVSLTSGNTEIVVKWSQKAKIKHCQIQVSQKKDFSSKKSVKFTISEKNEKHTKTVKGLKEGKTYYVRIRTYKTVGKKTYYSAWSEVKTIKTKTSTKKNAQARPVEMTVGEVLDLNTLLSQEEIEAVRSWSSDGTETAAVSPEGVVTAMQPGEAAVMTILEDDEAIEFTITVRENDIVLLDIGEGDLMIDLDENVLGDVLEDVETNFEIEEM